MAIIKKKTSSGETRYTAVLWHRNKAVKSKTFERKVDADSWLKRQEIAIDNGEVGRLKGQDVTVDEFFEKTYWPNRRVTEGTSVDYRRLYDQRIKPVFGHVKLSRITESEIAEFLGSLKLSNNRTNKVHTVFSAIFSLAVKWRYVPLNPLLGIEWRPDDTQKTDFWSKEEVTTFLNWAYTNNNPRFSFYQLAYETGMRVGEILALKRDCINLQDGFITVRRAWCRHVGGVVETTKNKKTRFVPISVSLKATLQKALGQHENEFVFLQPSGEPITYNYLAKNFKRDQVKAGVRVIGIHTLRHTFASHFVMNGGKMYELMKLLGHSTHTMTERYAHLANDYMLSQAGRVSFSVPVSGNVLSLPNTFPIMTESKRAHLSLVPSVNPLKGV